MRVRDHEYIAINQGVLPQLSNEALPALTNSKNSSSAVEFFNLGNGVADWEAILHTFHYHGGWKSTGLVPYNSLE